MKNLIGKVAAVTGAGSGIGRALALELAAQGCRIAAADINMPALEEIGALLEARGADCSLHLVDVSEAASVQAFADAVVSEHGAVHILINNAGINLQKSFEHHSLDDWQRVLGVNLWGVIYGCTFFLPHLRRSASAHIVNLSSMAGFCGLPSQSSYCASKAAVKALNESLWAELAVDGIGVTSVHPGAVVTNMIPASLLEADNKAVARHNYALVKKFGMSPERAAKIIVRAVRTNRQRVRVGPDAVLLDLLKRLFPVLIHRPMVKLFRMFR